MKKNLLSLLGILTIFNVTFSMKEPIEKQNQKNWYENFNDDYNAAKKHETEENIEYAFSMYGQLADQKIPSWLTDMDLLGKILTIQNNAAMKVLKQASDLQDKQKYEEALATYQYAPTRFAHNIQILEEFIKDALPQVLKAQEFADANNYKEAYELLKPFETRIFNGEVQKIKTKIEQQQNKWIIAERKRLKQEQQKAQEAEKMQKLESEKQQELKDKLILLTDTLKLLAKHIAHAPL